jgi:hypothetical protein
MHCLVAVELVGQISSWTSKTHDAGHGHLEALAKRAWLGVLLVGDTGFEPVTSSVSGKRAPTAPIAQDETVLNPCPRLPCRPAHPNW